MPGLAGESHDSGRVKAKVVSFGRHDSLSRRCMSFNSEKFKTLVLYVIWRTGDVRDFGATKLNKVLWFSDARAFEALGESITGDTYVRQKFGPVPRHITSVLT